jgi:hypothetical protein
MPPLRGRGFVKSHLLGVARFAPRWRRLPLTRQRRTLPFARASSIHERQSLFRAGQGLQRGKGRIAKCSCHFLNSEESNPTSIRKPMRTTIPIPIGPSININSNDAMAYKRTPTAMFFEFISTPPRRAPAGLHFATETVSHLAPPAGVQPGMARTLIESNSLGSALGPAKS